MFASSATASTSGTNSGRIGWSRLLALLAWPTALATVVAISPWTARHWAIDLTTHMQAHLMVAAFLLTPLLFWSRRRHLAALCLLAAAANAWAVRPWSFYQAPPRAGHDAATSGGTLRVLFWNVHVGSDDARSVLRLVAGHDADVVVLLEFNSRLRSELGPLRASHPHYREIGGGADPFGLAIYSRLAGSISRGRLSNSNPTLTLHTSPATQHAVQITGVHLYPPVGDAFWRDRNTQLSDLASQLVAGATAPRVVGGDFNITPWAERYRRFLQQADLVDTRPGFGYAATWPRWLGSAGIPIDQVAVDPEIAVLDRRVVYASPQSDHAAVLVTLAVPDGSAD